MRLVADRFIVTANDLAFDAATTSLVRLRYLPAESGVGEMAWEQRCFERFEGSGPAGERLIDYGCEVSGRRFEVTSDRVPRTATHLGSPESRASLTAVCREVTELLDAGGRPGPRRLVVRVTTAEAFHELLWQLARLARVARLRAGVVRRAGSLVLASSTPAGPSYHGDLTQGLRRVVAGPVPCDYSSALVSPAPERIS